MSRVTLPMTEQLHRYLLEVGVREPEVLGRLRAATAEETGGSAQMQISPEQGAFMAMLVDLMGARKTLEAGVFTGYSSTAVALALPEDGHLVACDVSEKWTAIARRFWKEAGVEDKIELRLGPAIETMDALLAEGEEGKFDFAFLDAVKTEYDAYYERTLRLLRPGGVMAVDNVLRSGDAADETIRDEGNVAIRAFNYKVHADERVSVALVPIADGLTLARKR